MLRFSGSRPFLFGGMVWQFTSQPGTCCSYFSGVELGDMNTLTPSA